MARNFIVKKAEHSTKQRMKEIQFWFIMKQWRLKHIKRLVIGTDYELYIDNMIENFCQLHNIKLTAIQYATSRIHQMFFRPTHLEIALATKYLNLPVRLGMKLGNVGNRKLYIALENYISKEGSYDLEPRFDQEIVQELEKFNRAFNRMFGYSSHISEITDDVYEKEDKV